MERTTFHKDGLVRVAHTPQECVRLDHSGWRQVPENPETGEAAPAEAASADEPATGDAEPHAPTPPPEAGTPSGEVTGSSTDPHPGSAGPTTRRRTRKPQ